MHETSLSPNPCPGAGLATPLRRVFSVVFNVTLYLSCCIVLNYVYVFVVSFICIAFTLHALQGKDAEKKYVCQYPLPL